MGSMAMDVSRMIFSRSGNGLFSSEHLNLLISNDSAKGLQNDLLVCTVLLLNFSCKITHEFPSKLIVFEINIIFIDVNQSFVFHYPLSIYHDI